jgi:hypothetical protein
MMFILKVKANRDAQQWVAKVVGYRKPGKRVLAVSPHHVDRK